MPDETQDVAPGERMNDPDGFEFAKDLIRRVGANVRDNLARDYETTWKSDNTPVTTVDTTSNQEFADGIHAGYPEDTVNGEEQSIDGTSGYTWVVDPVDGTQSLGIVPTATCCLSRTDPEGNPLFGFVYNPVTEELFAARKGELATRNGEQIRVSDKSTLKGSYVFLGSRMPETVATNGVVYDRLEVQGVKILNTRSLAFGCVMVASGKVEGAFIGVKTPYEAAAVKLIVEGAGGKVTDLYGRDPGRLDGEINGLVVSNGLIHEPLLEALRKEETKVV